MKPDLTTDDNWRDNAIKSAWEFVNVLWTPTEKNLYHGYDINGAFVNTPDINHSSEKYNSWWQPGKQNQGMPYNWGGICTVGEFEKAILDGKYAGNVPDTRDNMTSYECAGVDCSGLVTVCWGIQKKQSTKTLLSMADKLDSTDYLRPGDILLLPGSHVIIFVEFADDAKSSALIIEATRSDSKVLSRVVQLTEYINKGYAGYCYKNSV